jgi:hypothetical protein
MSAKLRFEEPFYDPAVLATSLHEGDWLKEHANDEEFPPKDLQFWEQSNLVLRRSVERRYGNDLE